MSLLTGPRTGYWKDESNHSKLQWLETVDTAQWYKIVVAICLTLSTPYISQIVLSSYKGFASLFSFTNNKQGPVPNGETRHTSSTGPLPNGKTGRQILLEFFSRFRRLEIRQQVFFVFLLGLLCSAFLSQIIASSILTDRVATNPVGLLASEKCGLYEYDNKKHGEDNASLMDSLMVERENRAAFYAQQCYQRLNHTDGNDRCMHDRSGNGKRGKAMNCDFFYTSALEYHVDRSPCPFERGGVCYNGALPGSPAVTFDTGILDSSLLGINANPTYKFQRTTTCAPLNAGSPYVKHFNNSPEDHGYLYEYGGFNNVRNECPSNPVKIRDYTMRIVGHPFEWLAPVYRLNTWATSLAEPRCDYYQPIEELKSVPGLNSEERTKTLTIVFVTALHIVYADMSVDPIFPATAKYRYPDDTVDYYMNESPKSRAFACIDETQFCDPTGKYCWHDDRDIPLKAKGIDEDPAYWFMVNALKKSNTYDSINLRLGSSLLAQQCVGEARSQALTDQHWELEAEHMFRTSLARAQFDTWSLASGEDHDQDGYKNTVDDHPTHMCGYFKFRTSGHVNISIWSFWVLCSVLPITFLLSVKLKTYRQIWHKTKHLVNRSTPKEDVQDGSAIESNRVNSEVEDNNFSVGSTSSTGASSGMLTDLPSPPTQQNDSENGSPPSGDSSTKNSVADGKSSLPSAPVADSTAKSAPTGPTTQPTASTAPAPPIDPRTPLISHATPGAKNYGTSSPAHSVRRSKSSIHADQSAPTVNPAAQPRMRDEANGSQNDQNDQEWSPLLIHGPILLIVHVTVHVIAPAIFRAVDHAVEKIKKRRKDTAPKDTTPAVSV